MLAGGTYAPLTIARFRASITNLPPTISSIADRTLVGAATEPLTTGPIGFTVNDPEGRTITVTAASSDPSVVPPVGIFLDGSSSSRSITVQPAASSAGQSTITLTASDGVRQRQRALSLPLSASPETLHAT